jgi:hypothetical protein
MQKLIVSKGQSIVNYCLDYKKGLHNKNPPDLGGHKCLDSYFNYGKKLSDANLSLYSSRLLLDKGVRV